MNVTPEDLIAIIPARAGSKGVIGKNKRLVAGKPLIQYTIDAALESKLLRKIVITTDDPDIIYIAHANGVEAVIRPSEHATDRAPVIGAVKHAIDEIETKSGNHFESIVLLQPTSPIRYRGAIDAAIQAFAMAGGAKPLCSVCRCEDNHPARMYTITDGLMYSIVPEYATARRQDLPPVYHRNGSIYIVPRCALNNGIIISNPMVPFEMPIEASINIDSEKDILLLEAFLQSRERLN